MRLSVFCNCSMKEGVFYFFGGFAVLMTVFIIFFYTETKGRSLEEVQRRFHTMKAWKLLGTRSPPATPPKIMDGKLEESAPFDNGKDCANHYKLQNSAFNQDTPP